MDRLLPIVCTRHYDELEKIMPRTSVEYYSDASVRDRTAARALDRQEEVRLTKERYAWLRAVNIKKQQEAHENQLVENEMKQKRRNLAFYKKTLWVEAYEEHKQKTKAARDMRRLILKNKRLCAKRPQHMFNIHGQMIKCVKAVPYTLYEDEDTDEEVNEVNDDNDTCSNNSNVV